jgi:hypothetical protein
MLNAHAIYAGLAELSPEPAWRLPIVYQLALCYERLGIPDRARTSFQSIVDGVGAAPTPDLAELAKMAAWRLDNLEWHDKVSHQVTNFFETTTGKISPPAVTAAAPTTATANNTTPAGSVPAAETPPAPKPVEAAAAAKSDGPPAAPAVATAKSSAVAKNDSHP